MSFLEIIQKYINKNNINFESIPISSNYFTYNMKKSILNFMKIYTLNVDYQDLEFFIRLDSNNYVYLECICDRVRLLILNDRLLYDTNNLIGQKIKERRFIDNTISLEFVSHSKKHNHDRFNRYNYYNEFITIAKDICNYISYLNNMYNNIINNKGVIVYEDNTNDNIFSKYDNDLSYQDRFKFLEDLNPVFTCDCISDKKNILKYKAYSYYKDNLYIVICIDNKDHIKICYYDNISSLEDFKDKLYDILSLSDMEVLKVTNMYQTKSSNYISFKNIISCAFDNYSNVSSYTKENIKRSRKNIKL